MKSHSTAIYCYALLIGLVSLSQATFAGSTRIVLYSKENVTSKSEPWMHLSRAFNGPDSKVHFAIESCLPNRMDVCDAFCGERIMHTADTEAFSYYDSEADFRATMRDVMHRLDTFSCSMSNIRKCTAESIFANSALAKTEEEWVSLETSFNEQLKDYIHIDNLGTLVRSLIIVETLLSDHVITTRRAKMTDKESKFLDWIVSKGVYLGPMLWPVESESGRRGVVAHRNVEEGDVLFESKGMTITPSLARAYFGIVSDERIEDDQSWKTLFQLVAFLAMQTELGDKAELYPYLAMLRESSDSGIYEWSDEELNQLEDERFVQGLEGIKKLQAESFAEWGDRLKLDRTKWHFEVFQWAFHVVTSRSFDLQEKTLLIFIDMLNHSEDFGQRLKFVSKEDDGTLSVIATQEVRRGDEIFINYEGDVAHLLYSFGFIPKPHGCLRHAKDGTREAFIEYYKCARKQIS